jgi:membrane protein implicated in regulation of membrane protease activity
MVDPLAGASLPLLLLLVGTVLIVAEAFAPGAHFIVLGVALFFAGLVGLFLPAGLGIFLPLVLAALVLVAGGLALYIYRSFDFYGGKGAGRTSDSSSLRGKSGRVTERVTESNGEVKLEDGGFNPHYQARTIDGEIEAGAKVIVVDPGGGNVLTVERYGIDEIDRELSRGNPQTDDKSGDRETDAETA